MKIIFLQDRDGRTLRKSIAFAPSCQLVHRGVNIASSDLGGKRSASFELLSLCPLLKALAFFLLSPVPSDSLVLLCDMSHKKAILRSCRIPFDEAFFSAALNLCRGNGTGRSHLPRSKPSCSKTAPSSPTAFGLLVSRQCGFPFLLPLSSKNLEGIMSAAEMGSDERHSPVGGEGKSKRQPDSPGRWYFFRGHWLMLWSCQRRRREKATEYRNNLLCEKRKQPTVTLQILLR